MALTNSQYDAIMLIYSERRLANTRLQEAHRVEAFKHVPELALLEREISEASLTAARRRVQGDKAAGIEASLHVLIQEKRVRRAELLEEAGYPADFLEPVYTCPLCKDTGFVNGERCRCFKQESTKLLAGESNLEELIKENNFKHFSMDYYSKEFIDPLTKKSSYRLMRENIEKTRDYINGFGTDFSNLMLYGNTGLGKTFLSHCIAAELLARNYFVIYFSAGDFFDTASKRHFANDASADVLYKRALEADLIILDDLGTEVPNSFSVSALFSFLNSRMDAKRSTIISTNLTLNQFKDIYGERIFSRVMSCFKFLAFVGNDIREQKRTLLS